MEYTSERTVLNTSSSCAEIITSNVQTMPDTVKEKVAILTTKDSNSKLNALQAGILLYNKEYVVFDLPNKNKDINNLIETLIEQDIMYATICSNELLSYSNIPLWKKPFKNILNKYHNNNNIELNLIDAGVLLIHPHNIIGTDIAHSGLLTKTKPTPNDVQDIASGIFVLNSLCRTNTGQSAISQLGKVIGIETEIENTEHLIQRCIGCKIDKIGGVLIKMTKPNQKEHLMFPTIDSNTILKVKESKLNGIVISANYCRIIDINKTLEIANKNNIFVLSI
ncbi:MAG: UDP-2,3-diacylglucosamine diphosphatase LpxI [Alphaproteobacteria bacterium]|nr:UDP-2,3-diacylglucosamine diphosphatase LpxI [Alphaproteobacteria bacterium]